MTPKEKAKELISIYFRLLPQKEIIEEEGGLKWSTWDNKEHMEIAKKCALICVDEVICGQYDVNVFWFDVKKEIENNK